jgi:hypothetical protein
MNPKSRAASWVVLICVLAISPFGRAQIIDTVQPWQEWFPAFATPFGEVGPGGYEVWGQTFTPPAGSTVLHSFDWWLQNTAIHGPDSVTFAAYVAEWNPTTLTINGEFLYSSDPRNLTGPDQSFEKFTFQTGGLLLDASKQYMLFLSARPFYNGIMGAGGVGGNSYEGAGDTYPGGKAYLAADFEKIAIEPWIRFANEAAEIGTTDFAVTIRFFEMRPIPEPSTYGAFAVFIVCAMVLRRTGLTRRFAANFTSRQE